MEFKVVKINHEYKNVVVSHKALIEDELEAQKAEIIKKLEKGQILEGTVKNITSMVYSSTLAALTDLSTSPTSAGDVSVIRKRLSNWIRKSRLLFLILMKTRNVLPSA
jgi:hypothetical protein